MESKDWAGPVPIKIDLMKTTIVYISSDGTKFTDKRFLIAHEEQLLSIRLTYYNKKNTLLNKVKEWLTGKELTKPYNF